jgi:hypothetical protein
MERAKRRLEVAFALKDEQAGDRWEQGGMVPEQIPQAAFRPVSLHSPVSGGNHHPGPDRALGDGMKIQRHVLDAHSEAFSKNQVKILFSLDSRLPHHGGRASHREPLPPLCAAAGQDVPSALRFHPGSESVNLFALPIVGLKRSFHGITSLILMEFLRGHEPSGMGSAPRTIATPRPPGARGNRMNSFNGGKGTCLPARHKHRTPFCRNRA